MKRGFYLFLIIFHCLITYINAQSNWKIADSSSFSYADTNNIWRSGNVAISHAFRSPFIYKLLVTNKYDSLKAATAYFSLNEPRYDLQNPDSTTVGLATNPNANYQGVVINNYANFKENTYFTDAHNSALEVNYNRGFSDILGFRDAGRLAKAASMKLAGSFGNNGRAYKNDSFDLLNLRFFTGNSANNLAEISNFYAIRLEDFRGVNPSIIKNGWGIYIAPTTIKNYFGGYLGIGTNNVSHALTVSANSDPVKITGLQDASNDTQILSIDNDGVLHKKAINSVQKRFLITMNDAMLDDLTDIYIHKGGNAIYTLPAASARTGKSWKIVNIGTGTLTLSVPFYEGNQSRNSILNVPNAYSYELFSDGSVYISIR